jgi:hypothetical protein
MRPLAHLGLASLPQEFVASLPEVAVVVGWLALIWLACAVVATVGIYFARMGFYSVRWIVHVCRRAIQRHGKPAYAHLVTIEPTGVRTRPVTARGAHRWFTRDADSTRIAATDRTAHRRPNAPGNVKPDSDHGSDPDSGGEPS